MALLQNALKIEEEVWHFPSTFVISTDIPTIKHSYIQGNQIVTVHLMITV
jgi:hypothetical protein